MSALVSDRAAVFGALARGLRPPRRRTTSEWADAERMLPRETSPEYGHWRTARAPFTREIMDALGMHDPAEYVVWMKASQVAGTEVGLNWCGYAIEEDPSSILLVVPSDAFGRRYMRRRVKPMISACPSLQARVSEARRRDRGGPLSEVTYSGGSLLLASAQSAASLSSDPIRRVMLDEVDRYPLDVRDEGSPVQLADVRTTNFPNRKVYITSTPRTRETSLIEPLFLQGDRRRYLVACPACGHEDFLTWRGADPFKSDAFGVIGADGVRRHFAIVWDEDRAETARLECPACHARIEEHHKPAMLERGRWAPTAAGDGVTKSYHLPGMYSPLGWLSWAKMVREFLAADEALKRGSREAMKVFVNTRLGECWEETVDKIEKQPLLRRAEDYHPQVPAGVGVLVGAVDVQDTRLEALVMGYGAGEESWLVDFRQFHGDPENDALWFELDEWLAKPREHANGRAMPVERVAVDSGGHHTEKVYEFCKLRLDRGIFAVRGGTELGQPLLGKATTNNRLGTPLFTLCVDTGKDRVYSRLKITSPGPGYMHFPRAAWFDDEYVAQLTSERKVPSKFLKGRGSIPFWKKTRDRNEALDLTVYALAALYMLGPDFIESLAIEAEHWAKSLDEDASAPAESGGPAPAAGAIEPPPFAPPAEGFTVNPFQHRSWMNWRK